MMYSSILFFTITLVTFMQSSEHIPISVQVTRSYIGGRCQGSAFIRECMEKYGIDNYFTYFNQIAQTPHGLLPDEIKITGQIIKIPFFSTLHKRTKEEQEQIFDDFTQEKFVLNYLLWRLFLAGLAHADIGDKGYILCTAIGSKDDALVEQLLKQGANANSSKCGYSSLWYCQRPQEARLLVARGADVAEHHQKNDLIGPICMSPDLYDDEDGIALMDFYLRSGVELNEKNNFGRGWFKILLRNLHIGYSGRKAVEAKIELLWNAGRSRETTLRAINRFLQKWDCYSIVRKLLRGGVIYRLQQRALTGHHFTKIQPIIMKHTSTKK